MPPAILDLLIPPGAALQLRSIEIEVAGHLLCLQLKATQTTALCPLCNYPTTKIQSHYHRTLADLTWADFSVRLLIQLRRFFCVNEQCLRRVFCERLAPLTQAYARTTTRLRTYFQNLALALGGRPGARFAAHQNQNQNQHQNQHPVISRSSLLRLIRSYTLPLFETPRVLGVDDFSLKRGLRYATLLVDLEKRQPIEVLPDRSSATFASWLEAHPGIEIISRDRASSYASAAEQSAPQAIQVADRFHIQQNLTGYLHDFFRRKKVWTYNSTSPSPSPTADVLVGSTPTPPPTAGVATDASSSEVNEEVVTTVSLTTLEVEVPPASPALAPITPRVTVEEQRKQARLEERLERYQNVTELSSQGLSNREISKQTGLDRNTVNKYVQAQGAEVVASVPKRLRPSILDRYKPYIYERWEAEQPNIEQLYIEIKSQGYKGSIGPIRAYLAALRPKPNWSAKRNKVPLKLSEETLMVLKPKKKLSSREAAWLIFRSDSDKSQLKAEQVEELAGLRKWQPEVEEVYQMVQTFREMVKEKQSSKLGEWLERAKGSGVKELLSFSRGIEQDLAAVEAGLSLEYSNGQLEGQVNRVKNIKRSMFGKAKFDLLRKRILARN